MPVQAVSSFAGVRLEGAGWRVDLRAWAYSTGLFLRVVFTVFVFSTYTPTNPFRIIGAPILGGFGSGALLHPVAEGFEAWDLGSYCHSSHYRQIALPDTEFWLRSLIKVIYHSTKLKSIPYDMVSVLWYVVKVTHLTRTHSEGLIPPARSLSLHFPIRESPS